MENTYSMPQAQSYAQYFWKYVEPIMDDRGCWEWRGGLGRFGYGAMNVNGKTQRAHRVAWTIHRGDVPEGLCVLHRCDNPPCVNPAHLFLGTYLDNVRDMDEKGRRKSNPRYGKENGNAKLTSEQAAEIVRRYNSGEKGTALAREFGMSQPRVSAIICARARQSHK